MSTVAFDSGEAITVPCPRRQTAPSLEGGLKAAREDVVDAAPSDPDDAVGVTLCALERYLPGVSLPDVLELRVFVYTDASTPEHVFIDITEQALHHLADCR